MRKGSEKEGKSFFVFLRRSRLMKGLVLMIVLVLVLVLAKKPRQKVVTLQPLLAREIEDSVAEPSGATFCASTSSLFLICDRTSVCGGVFEMDMEGSLLRNWLFPRKHKDVEAVACDDFNKRLYIAEEGHMRVTSFVLPRLDDPTSFGRLLNEESGEEELFLIEQAQFPIDIEVRRLSTSEKVTDRYLKAFREPYLKPHDDPDDIPGLEGLTWDPIGQGFLIANEKEPPLIMFVPFHEGTVERAVITEYSKDLSGLAFDEELGLLWVLSDKSEQVFLTDTTGKDVLDYWDLPMENPEGIAIDNTANPPLMYIVTDPSSPHGKQYVSAVFKFIKPVQGTGNSYFNASQPPLLDSQSCDGCEQVWEDAESTLDAGLHSKPLLHEGFSLIRWGSALVIGVMLLLVSGIVLLFRVRTARSSPPAEAEDTSVDLIGISLEDFVGSSFTDPSDD